MDTEKRRCRERSESLATRSATSSIPEGIFPVRRLGRKGGGKFPVITVARIDERLIHGQVAYAWTVAYKSEIIMVVDDEVAKDQFQVSLLQMACPAGVKCAVCGVDRGAELLKKHEARKIFVVVKHPRTLLELHERGVKIPEINVGGLYFKEGRRQLSKTVYVDAEMEEIFHKLHDAGIALENRTHPNDGKEDLMKLL